MISAEAPDLLGAVSTGFTGFDASLLALAGIGIGITLVKWGLPMGVRFVKKLAS